MLATNFDNWPVKYCLTFGGNARKALAAGAASRVPVTRLMLEARRASSSVAPMAIARSYIKPAFVTDPANAVATSAMAVEPAVSPPVARPTLAKARALPKPAASFMPKMSLNSGLFTPTRFRLAVLMLFPTFPQKSSPTLKPFCSAVNASCSVESLINSWRTLSSAAADHEMELSTP